MESYGIIAKSDLIIEHVRSLPVWKESDQGRIIYNKSTKRCYLGKFNEWELFGIYEKVIKSNHLFVDNELTGSNDSISALHIPICLDSHIDLLIQDIANGYDNRSNFFHFDSTSNVQFAFDAIYNNLKQIPFDIDSINSVSSAFTTNGITHNFNDIQNELDNLHFINKAFKIELLKNDFGTLIGFNSVTVMDAIVEIVGYISPLDTDNLPIYINNIGSSNVQFIIDEFHRITSISKFIDLLDVPDGYSENPLVALRSDGNSQSDWMEPGAQHIKLKFPNVFGKQNDDLENIIINDEYFYPSEDCSLDTIQNTIMFGSLSYKPLDFYTTGVQQGINMIREIQCAVPPRALSCEPSLVVGSQWEFDISAQLEQYKDDAKCCPITENNNDEDWNLIYNTWYRFSHEKGYSTQPAISTHLNAYSLTSDGLKTIADTHSHNGVISFNAYDCFEFEITITSDTLDNDMIGVVVAWHVDEHGWEHTLTALRIHGSNEYYMGIEGSGTEDDPGIWVQWALVYNYRQDTEWLIADGTDNTQMCPISPHGSPWTEETGWFNHFTKIKVYRKNNQIVVSCTDWDTESPFIAPLSINLDSDSRLQMFKGPKQYGYSAHSTMNATWERQSIKCIDCGSTNCRRLELVNENGCVIVQDSIELASLKTTLSLNDTNCFGSCEDAPLGSSIPIDFQNVFDTWSRLVTGDATVDNWHMSGDQIVCSSNRSGMQYFLSPEKYENYSFELTVTSPDSDDDFIYVVIAGDLSGNNICAVRSLCACNYAPTVWPTWVIVYNFGKDDREWLAWNDGIGDEAHTGGWNGRYSRIKVCRSGNDISIIASRFNSLDYAEESLAVLNLQEDLRLNKFMGPQSIGFGCLSQNLATFYSPSLYEVGELSSGGAVQNIYDSSEDTLWVWVSSSCSWEPTVIDMPCGGDSNAPGLCSSNAPTSCSQLDTETRRIYDIRTHDMYDWNNITCKWDKFDCPNWMELDKNTIYYNDITCKIFFFDCDRQWRSLN